MLLVRERPPLRLDIDVAAPSGARARWGNDDPNPENAPGSLTFSTTMPGGFEQASLSLERNPKFSYPDLEELSTVTIRGAGGRVAWQGRVETLPDTSGDQIAISPGLVGWQNHLQDDSSAQEVFIDPALTSWQGASTIEQINLLNNNIDETDGSVNPDASGFPSFATQLTGPWSREATSHGWYGANGIDLGALYYAWQLQSTTNIGDDLVSDTNWDWQAILSTDDAASSVVSSGNLRGFSPGQGTVTAGAGYKYASVQLSYTGAAGNDGVNYAVYWTYLAAVGTHGLPIQGTLTATGGIGILASDAIGYAVGKWAPKLAYSTGSSGTVQPSTFVIPQLVFTTPTTVAQMIQQAAQYEILDWAVWEGGPLAIPTFYLNTRGARGNTWRAQSGPAQLQEAGAQVSELWNGAIVSFTDTAGKAWTVGPPGSDAAVTDSSLQDPDPLNPANQAGINRWGPVTLGTSTFAGAIATGADYLQAQKELDSSGQASLVGHVQDNNGVYHPAWAVRAGDTITFSDAADSSTARRIVSTSYDDSSKTCQVQLDTPPDSMTALLARLSASTAAIGLS